MNSYSVITIDFETTGVDPKKDRPVQIGLVEGLTEPRIIMNMLVDPYTPIDPKATEIHGISQNHVYGHPDYLMGLHLALLYLRAEQVRCGAANVFLTGFNSQGFDIPMADACYGSAPFSSFPQLDVMALAYRYYPSLESKKLVSLYEHFIGTTLTGAHGATADCLGTVAVLAEICKDLNKSPPELAHELQTPIVYDIMPIGKHRGTAAIKVPRSWAAWMRNNATGMIPDLQKTVDWILDER